MQKQEQRQVVVNLLPELRLLQLLIRYRRLPLQVQVLSPGADPELSHSLRPWVREKQLTGIRRQQEELFLPVVPG